MRRLILATAGLLLISISGGSPGDSTAEGTICPVPSPSNLEARLLAVERENGCLDIDADVQAQGGGDQSWPPGWKTASMLGRDVVPARVVSDPYPTLHSVVIDAER